MIEKEEKLETEEEITRIIEEVICWLLDPENLIELEEEK